MKRFKSAAFYDKALLIVLPFTAILGIILYFITGNNNAEIKSLLIGLVVSISLNYFHYRETLRISEMSPEKLKKFTIFSYILRYLSYIALVVVATLFGGFNPVYIGFGICEYPLLIVIMTFTSFKGD